MEVHGGGKRFPFSTFDLPFFSSSLINTKPKYFFVHGQLAGDEQLAYFIREPGAIITAETFDAAVEFGTVRCDPTDSVLRYMTCLHAPLVTLSTNWEKSSKDNYTNHMHCYLSGITGEYFSGAETVHYTR